MNKPNHSEDFRRSSNNRSISLSTKASTFADASGDKDSFYDSLLRHHRSMLFVDDTTSKASSADMGETCKKESSSDLCNQSQNKNSFLKASGRCLRRSSVGSRGSSMPSLYPTIDDDSFDGESVNDDRIYNSNARNDRKSKTAAPALVVPHASPSYKFNDRRASGADQNETAPLLSRASSFYRAALEEAAVLGKCDQGTLLQVNNENYSSRTSEDIGAVDISTPTRAVGSYGMSEHNEKVPALSSPKSPFYRAALEDAEILDYAFGEQVGERQSTTCSFSSSSISSNTNTAAASSVATPPNLSRATTMESNVSEVQRHLSGVSFSPSSVLQIETEPIAPDPSSQSFVDDSCAFSVTRSSAMPYMTNSVSLRNSNEAVKLEARNNASLLMGMKKVCNSPADLHYSKAISEESENDEDDEDLRMAIYLSRVESSTASSFNSDRTCSTSFSTKGSRAVGEAEKKNNHQNVQNVTSDDLIENDNEFLMSQLRAMEECQRNNSTKCGPSIRDHSMTSCSSESSNSCQNHFQSGSLPLRSGGKGQTRRRRSMLEERGATETRQAISNGDSHVVKCKGCNGRLKAPMHYSLVFCPNCQTVSPA